MPSALKAWGHCNLTYPTSVTFVEEMRWSLSLILRVVSRTRHGLINIMRKDNQLVLENASGIMKFEISRFAGPDLVYGLYQLLDPGDSANYVNGFQILTYPILIDSINIILSFLVVIREILSSTSFKKLFRFIKWMKSEMFRLRSALAAFITKTDKKWLNKTPNFFENIDLRLMSKW